MTRRRFHKFEKNNDDKLGAGLVKSHANIIKLIN